MRFFFYGTLMEGLDNPVARALQGKLSIGIEAVATGKLYAIPDPEGWYPALISGEGEVRGFQFTTLAEFTSADLKAMDDWEGAEYRRVPIMIRLADDDDGVAEAYLYCKPLPEGAERIADGDFLAFLARTGRSAFGAGR